MPITLSPQSTIVPPQPMLRERLLAEAVGTFVLVFAGCGAAMVDAQNGALGHVGICLTFGLAVTAVVYAVGHVSGAHINPAVTLGLASTGHFPWRDVPAYIAVQCIAGALAAYLLASVIGPVANIGATAPAGSELQGVVIEFFITAVLMFVIVGVGTDPRAVPGMTGLVVGGTVTLLALFAGPLTGASMNPARSLGPALAAGDLSHVWIYMTAPVSGAVAGSILYEACRPRAGNAI